MTKAESKDHHARLAMTGAYRLDARRRAIPAAMATKVALVLPFLVALDQVEGKGMAYRFPLLLLVVAVVPLAWRKRFSPYPATADVLLVAPLLLDTLANVGGFYDSFVPTDDLLHTLNGMLLVGSFHAWRFRNPATGRVLSDAEAWLLGTGIGALATVSWEVAEFVVAETGAGGGLRLTYADTVGDLIFTTAGGMLGSWLGVRFLGDRQSRTSLPFSN